MGKGYPKTKSEVCEQPVGPPVSGVANVAPDVGSEEGRKRNDEEGVPTSEEVAGWRREVVTTGRTPHWKEFSGSRFEVRCFAVEWRDSVLLEEKFLEGLFGLIGGEGSSFVLGMETRKPRADYLVVIRLDNPVRWRDWQGRLMFGHGVEGKGHWEGMGLFVRVFVPAKVSAEGTVAFAKEMIGRCDNVYTDTVRYRESDLTREYNKGYGRPGRKRKVDER